MCAASHHCLVYADPSAHTMSTDGGNRSCPNHEVRLWTAVSWEQVGVPEVTAETPPQAMTQVRLLRGAPEVPLSVRRARCQGEPAR